MKMSRDFGVAVSVLAGLSAGMLMPGRCLGEAERFLWIVGVMGTVAFVALKANGDPVRIRASVRRVLSMASGVVAVLWGASPVFATGPSPFDGLASTIDQSSQLWAPALMGLGAVITGGAIAMGHHAAGEKARNYVLGAAFLALAALGAAAIGAKMKGMLN